MTFCKTLKAATRTKSLPAAILCIALVSACRQPEKPVTDTEALDFAKAIETSVTQHNQNVLNNIIDPKYFCGLVLRETGQRFNFSMARKARASLAQYHFGEDVISATRQNGNYLLVRKYLKDGHQHLLFRLVTEDGQLNYDDYELIKGDQGVRAVDLYMYATGEQLSKMIIANLQETEKGSLTNDTDRENDRLTQQAQQFLTGGNPEEAWSFYDQITDKAKKEIPIQKLHIRIAQKLSDSAFRAALEEYRSANPRDPFSYFSIFKNDVRVKDYPGSLDALDRFERFLPSDPFLDVYRVLLYTQMNDPQQSRLALERLHVWNPLNFNVTVALVENHIKADHPDSAAMLILEAENRKILTPEQVDTLKRVYPALRPYLK